MDLSLRNVGSLRSIGRTAALRLLPPYRRLSQAFATASARIAELEMDRIYPGREVAQSLKIRITRGDRRWEIEPALFEVFAFRSGDELEVVPRDQAARLPTTWGDTHVRIAPGRAIRVPSLYNFFEFKGFKIPAHLISLTGAGPETLDLLGRRHIDLYDRFIGLAPDMAILDLGCGIGRDAFQLIGYLSEKGSYIGIDVTRDSILWCQDNISVQHPNMTFLHFDAENELYNPYGTKTSMDFDLPIVSKSIDRIFLSSVFTHLLEEEVLHYMKEFQRVLKPSGLAYASFFLYSEEALSAAKSRGTTPWAATFKVPLGDGVYGNDAAFPRGAVAFTDQTMQRLIHQAGLKLVRPYLKGSWSGLHDNPDDGQDVAILQSA